MEPLTVRLLGNWAEHAACNAPSAPHPEAFFPETELGHIAAENWPTDALRTCGTCPVRRECLAYALANKVEGVWGGTTDIDRKHLQAAARKKAA